MAILQAPIKKVYDNTSTEIIAINVDKLSNKLNKFLKKATKSKDCLGAFALCVTIFISLSSTTFNNWWFLTGKQWNECFKFIGVCSLGYFFYTFWNLLFNRVNVDDIINDLKKE